jgi:hypothetical protein
MVEVVEFLVALLSKFGNILVCLFPGFGNVLVDLNLGFYLGLSQLWGWSWDQ